MAQHRPTRKRNCSKRETWFKKLVVNFGNDEGEEGSYSGTVIQALLLMNGQDINNAIDRQGRHRGRLSRRNAGFIQVAIVGNSTTCTCTR